MSQEIEILEKKIYINKPFENAKGQYNYGRVNNFDSFKVLGKSQSALDNTDLDLYSHVISKIDFNKYHYPNGLLHGIDSEIEFYSVITRDAGPDTNDDKYYSAAWAFYMYDTETLNSDILLSLDALNGSGNKIKAAIGTGDGFDQTPGDGKYRIGYRYWGYQNEHSSLTNQVTSGPNVDDCEKFDVHHNNYCGPGLGLHTLLEDSSDGRGTTISKRFHLGSSYSSTGTSFDYNMFTKSLLGVERDSREDNIIMLTRTAADEKEWALFGHGWGGLGSGYKNDELDRVYIKSKIPKSELYEIWKEQSGQIKLFNFHYSNYPTRSTNRGSISSLNSWEKEGSYRDEYGEHKGHSDSISENDRSPVNIPRSVQIRVKAPTFNPVYAITGSSEGGIGANWVLKGDSVNEGDDGTVINQGWWCLDTQDETLFPNGERKGLHPRYNIDFFGWPDNYYYPADGDGKVSNTNKYFHSEYIKQIRPISFVSSSFNTPDAGGDYHGVDLQSYYENDTQRENILRAQSSAPNNVRLKFKLAKSLNSTTIKYIDTVNPLNEDGSPNYYSNLDYYFFVVNWDWKDGDPGGGDCESPELLNSDGWGNNLSFENSEISDCLTQIGTDFPTTNAELESKMFSQNTYNIAKIGSEYYCYGYPKANAYCENNKFTTEDNESCGPVEENAFCRDRKEKESSYLEHSYVEPGVKIIKAIVLSTLSINDKYTNEQYYWNNNETDNPTWGTCTDDTRIYDGNKNGCEGYGQWIPNEDYTNYVQAVHWDLVTIRINLTADGAFPMPDFDSVGGEEYTYIPYPDTNTVFTEAYQGYGGSGDAPLYTEQGNTYKSSHPIISGLSSNSKYVNSLRTILKEDKFGAGEVNEKMNTTKARNLSPIGHLNELGDYLGQSDIAQIRLFNNSVRKDGKPLDMTTFLEISDTELVDPLTTFFYPYYNFGYWTGNPEYTDENGVIIPAEPKFKEESPVGDIFISEYDHYKNLCLLELNLGTLDGKTIYDSSGNGNKGIIIGDFAVKKDEIGFSPTRDSSVKTPKTGTKEGAF